MSKLITAAEVAEKLGVKVSWVMAHAAPGCPEAKRIPSVKVGHYTRFNEGEIDAWIERGCKQEGSPKIRTLKIAANQK